MAVTCHHGFCDATGALTLARDLFAVYRGIVDDPPGFRPPSRAPYERSTDRILALYSEGERQQALAEEGALRRPVALPGGADREGGTARIARRTLAPERLGRIKAFGREHGATVNDVLIGAFFLAFQKIRDDPPSDREEPRSFLTSADLRRRYPGLYEDSPLTNLSIAYEITLAAGEGGAAGGDRRPSGGDNGPPQGGQPRPRGHPLLRGDHGGRDAGGADVLRRDD
ncbi:hypothetical protein [Methanoculleus chikugoensis]|uniref:hypothetical protein n=1 Tax=Methanoculleus chikugoensis TaxID=118126 RepID=UPI001FB36592|nr:hypothetical protein [Methanoculleus chikugoensis]